MLQRYPGLTRELFENVVQVKKLDRAPPLTHFPGREGEGGCSRPSANARFITQEKLEFLGLL